MARKPKADEGKARDASVGSAKLTSGDEVLAARRGRRPKSVAASPEVESSVKGDATLADASADSADIELVPAPIRRRPGPKPKQRDMAPVAATLTSETVGKRGRKPRQSTLTDELSTAVEGIVQANAAERQDSSGDINPVGSDGAVEISAQQPAPPTPSLDQANAAKPAAQWDQSTDIAKFDWAAIENTAAQPGPNQVMAKLLIAAQAEGANSRWPL